MSQAMLGVASDQTLRFGLTPAISIVKERNSLEEIRVRDLRDDALFLAAMPQGLDKSMLPPLLAALAVPILSKLMPLAGIHSRDEFESVQGFAGPC